MTWGHISGSSSEYPYSILARASVSRQHLSMCSYPEDDKTKFADKVDHFAC